MEKRPHRDVSIDFEQAEEGLVCHHATTPHLLGEQRECFNCHNARILARDLGGDETLLHWHAEHPTERPGEPAARFIHGITDSPRA